MTNLDGFGTFCRKNPKIRTQTNSMHKVYSKT